MTVNVNPTARLPPIATIATHTTARLVESVEYLQELYQPRVRGSRRKHGGDDDSDNDSDVQSDAFERAYAIRWLTALIARLQDRVDTDALVQRAAALLATCAGVAAAGRIQRRFTFESPLAGQVHVALTDIPLDNDDYASVGAQTWGGACVLAEMIAERPDRFGLGSAYHLPLRILELGAGTGLVGLAAAKILHALSRRSTTIVLTDFYPAVLDNLQSNIDTNFPAADDIITVHSHFLDWSSFSAETSVPEVLSTRFDVVFGADVIYEVQHAVWLRDCLKSLLSYPDDSKADPMFHLVIPLRPSHTLEFSTVEEVFGSKNHSLGGSHRELVILSKESVACEAYGNDGFGRNRSGDVEYVYYRIGWTR